MNGESLTFSELLEAYAGVQGELAAERAKAKEVIRQLQLEVEALLEGKGARKTTISAKIG